MDTWHKVERGIRCREHPTRRHGTQRRPDRYYVIRIAVDGVMRQEALGWESEGICASHARRRTGRPGSGFRVMRAVPCIFAPCRHTLY